MENKWHTIALVIHSGLFKKRSKGKGELDDESMVAKNKNVKKVYF